ncbi:MAG: alpha/beta fold hydrolase [Promethearchaeota archaeon]
MYIEVNGIHLNTVSFGSGSRAVLAHGGFVVGWEMWMQGFEELSKRWRCVSYDHRGTGECPASPHIITDETIIEDVFGVLDHLKIKKSILMGKSIGGRVVLIPVF